ncbi:blastula protease 10-like [Tubulanus polymorphus]|uniref:blastula protease 10-like n=1 Tax=Tubulanus polymorphus TaxID=672921 RepID=UPI003DA2BF2A
MIYSIVCFCVAAAAAVISAVPVNEDDVSQFQSIDQAILAASGGKEAFSGSFRAAGDGKILSEFDMVLSEEQAVRMYLTNPASRNKRKATSNMAKRWPDAKVYYYIKAGDFNVYELKNIRAAMDEYEKLSCLTFTEVSPNDPRNRIRIQNGVGCNSHLGMSGGAQPLNLGPGCRYKGTVIHELGHAIGWVHEHQLPDRDEYLEIIYENVNPAWRVWFNKLPWSEVNNYGVHYDYLGIMHYGTTAFSDKGKQTIKAKDPSKEHLIQDTWHKKTLAWSDTQVANFMYQCDAHCPANLKGKCVRGESFLNKECKCQHKDTTWTDPLTGAVVKSKDPEPPCVNNNSQCQYWADIGECKKNPAYMLPNCRVSCGTCPGQTTTTANPNCLDNNDQCPYWANIGECKKNPRYMLPNCRKSCQVC